MKLTWFMIKRQNKLWVKVLNTIYMKCTSSGLVSRKLKKWSSCWRGLNETWATITGGLF
ncbi:hypothetical protein LINPERHAP1_LOCUS24395 [Linum perenne]